MRKALTRTTLIANVIEHHKQSLENPLIDDTTLETQNFLSKKRVCTIVNENYFSHCVNIFLQVYRSCREIQDNTPGAVSDVYQIHPLPNAEPIEVYCEMAIDGGGFTFLPRSLTRRTDAQQIVNALFKDKKNVLLKLQKKVDRSESYTLIQPHSSFANTDFGILINNYTGYTKPQNQFMKEYIFFGIIPASAARNNNSQGFKSNGHTIQFKNSDKNPNNLFVFLPNHNLQTPSNYHPNLVYETRGVAVDWRSKAIPITNPDRMMPNKFFFLTELHFGGDGCYTSSDRWNEYGYHATAIGIR